MSENCFLRQKATSEIISSVAGFCAECYTVIQPNETIFYDMQNCRYLCQSCQENIKEKLDEKCEPLNLEHTFLFN